MAWEEWEQLKAEAAEQHTARMQLNQTEPGSGVDTGSLVSDKKAWAKAGHDIGSLREGIGKALDQLSDGQNGLGADSGCRTAGAQKEVHASWERYVKAVNRRCGALAGLLEKAGNEQLRTDDSVRAAIGNLKIAYGDTPAIGGQGKGR
ncbi:hypothetical protein [Streptomyces flavofungini]|uniref:AG2 protein n=1 Tax=Streptomyces flavofungini TaxID=68200 RepID=A0ABS0WZB9_9ACTN|nr:hypothetical protein [Streptomyces flavofungini]MBJ3806256.1 hypothetical protein [Streptomyces flavofungini]GHC46327.1 hypothetical protein GCM10010349_09080 [Streptomyces flavofungini]